MGNVKLKSWMLWLSGNSSSLGKCQIKFRSSWTECSGSDWSIVWATPPEELSSLTYPKDRRSFASRLLLATKLMRYIRRIALITILRRVVFSALWVMISLFSPLLLQQYQTKESTHDIRCTRQKILEMPFIPVCLCTKENHLLFST